MIIKKVLPIILIRRKCCAILSCCPGSINGFTHFSTDDRLNGLGRGYSKFRVITKNGIPNYGPKMSLFMNTTMFFIYTSATVFFWTFLDVGNRIEEFLEKQKIRRKFRVDAGGTIDVAPLEKTIVQNETNDSGDKERRKSLKKHVGFRDRKYMAYENRIRQYSTPDKQFRYFATYKIYAKNKEHTSTNFEVFMTPEDFVRSISPNELQPKTLRLDHFRTFDPEKYEQEERENDLKIFERLGMGGLISFSDYIFLLTVLSTSPRHFEIAFKMFDINGDGELEYKEFEKVNDISRDNTAMGNRHRNHVVTGNTLLAPSHSALAKYFFGENLDQKLTISAFLNFQKELQRDILRIEFDRHDPDEEGRIKNLQFCDMILMHSGFSDDRRILMKNRVRKWWKKCVKTNVALPARGGVGFNEIVEFFNFITHIDDVETALSFQTLAGISIDKETFKHVAQTVARAQLSDHVVNIVFTLFDENNDGELSNEEFVAVMKRRLHRGLEKPKDTGLFRFITALWKCSWDNEVSSHY